VWTGPEKKFAELGLVEMVTGRQEFDTVGSLILDQSNNQQ